MQICFIFFDDASKFQNQKTSIIAYCLLYCKVLFDFAHCRTFFLSFTDFLTYVQTEARVQCLAGQFCNPDLNESDRHHIHFHTRTLVSNDNESSHNTRQNTKAKITKLSLFLLFLLCLGDRFVSRLVHLYLSFSEYSE